MKVKDVDDVIRTGYQGLGVELPEKILILLVKDRVCMGHVCGDDIPGDGWYWMLDDNREPPHGPFASNVEAEEDAMRGRERAAFLYPESNQKEHGFDIVR